MEAVNRSLKIRDMKLSLISILLLLMHSCKQDHSDWIDRSKHQGLYNIGYSELFETYATQENPKNIKGTVKNLEQAKLYYDKIFSEDLAFAVLFVDNKNWDDYAFSPPPGMPQAYYEGNIVLGLGKSAIAKRAEQGLKEIPKASFEALKVHFGNNIDLDLFYRDALSLHELAHLYQFYRTGRNFQRRWLNELFGNLCQIGASKNLTTPAVFNQMDAYQMFLIKADRWGEINHTTLMEFEEHYFDIMKKGRNYGWYQTQFYEKAKALYTKFGDDFIDSFRDFLIETNPEEIGNLDEGQLQKLIRQKFGPEASEMLKWKYQTQVVQK